MRKSRALICAAGLAAVVGMSQASAEPVRLSPVAFSAEFQSELDDELGPREGEYLRAALTRNLSDSFARRGATLGENGAVSVDVVIVDADPNRPTLGQMTRRPGLDYFRSVSIGGAELHAVLRSADGGVLREVDHRRYNHTLSEIVGPPGTWEAAQRAMRRFSEKVADAYVEQAR